MAIQLLKSKTEQKYFPQREGSYDRRAHLIRNLERYMIDFIIQIPHLKNALKLDP
jgi:hypothetical protein